MKRVHAVYLSLFMLFASPALPAAVVHDDMKEALHALALSQDLKTFWPVIMRNAAIDGAARVERGAMDRINTRQDLTPTQREQVTTAVKSVAGKVAVELDEMNRQIDIEKLVEDLVQAVYPKYYSVAEIRQLTAFYNNPAFKKIVQAELAITAESKLSGSDSDKIRTRVYAAIPEQDSRVVVAFSTSELGRKQKRIASQVNADMMATFQGFQRPAFDAIIARNSQFLQAQMRALK